MTLKEKFNVISCKDCAMPYCDRKCTMLSHRELNELEQIAEDFAIGFADWMQQNTIYNGSEYYAYIGDCHQYKLNKLLEIYKKEKGL